MSYDEFEKPHHDKWLKQKFNRKKKKCQFCSEVSEEIYGILACGGYNLEREK